MSKVDPAVRDDGRLLKQKLLIPIACLLILIIAALGLVFNRNAQIHTYEQSAAEISRDLAGHIAELDVLMSALIGIHQASSQDSQGNLITLTEKLQQQHPIISGIGHYSIVPLSERSSFEQSMEEQGLYNFRISEISDSGLQIANERAVSMPVSSINPMNPKLLGLLGSDLAAHQSLFYELKVATRENRSVIMQSPDRWIVGNQLLFFKPTYRGTHIPLDPEERTQQSNGGYLVIIDPQALLSDQVKQSSILSLDIDIKSVLGDWHVFSQQSAVEPDGVIPLGLKSHTIVNSLRFGQSTVNLTLSGKIAILLPYLLYTLLTQLVVVFWLLMGYFFTENRRKTQQERERNREALYEEREKAARTLSTISDAVITVNDKAIIQHVNPAGAKLLNDQADNLSGELFDNRLPLRGLGKDAGQVQLIELLDRLDEGVERADFELAVLEDSSSKRVLHTTLSRASKSVESDVVFTVILRDISAELNLRRALERQANHDALTGCTNRHFFESRLLDLLNADEESVTKNALLYIDLDQFKIINDTAGHRTGDQLLIDITARISRILREGDSLSRIGGDEFGVIITDVDKKTALQVAQSIFSLFDKYIFVHKSYSFPVSASLGLVHFSETPSSTTDILAASDLACYAAKDGGRNQLFVYSADDKTMAERSEELTWLDRLRQAFESESFRLHIQPLANLNLARRVTHFEFLLRLADDSGEEISPWQIINAAERYDLMRDLDRWIINHALELIASINHFDGVAFSINLSGQSAADSKLPEFIKEKYIEHRVNPACVCFEITETAAISNLSTAVELIECIHSLGSKVALDDFGSGLSSFGYLKNLPVDILKIDGQFVRELASNDIDRAMVKAIHDVGRSMNLTTVAEYVETAEIVEVLEAIGIDYAQGYFIGKPKPFEQSLQEVFGEHELTERIAA